MNLSETVQRIVHRIEGFEALDTPAKPAARLVQRLTSPRAVKDTLSGTWLGHPLHPVLTDVTIGAWVSALLLDLLGGKAGRRAARSLVGVGVLSAAPTAAAGLSDWSDTLGGERRIGLVHAAANTAGLLCYGKSYFARRRGDHLQGVTWGLAGATAAGAGAYLGGHLVFRLGVWIDRNVWRRGAQDWEPVIDGAEVVEGQPVKVHAADDDVLLCRLGGRIHAIGAVCGHAGGPLHEGALQDGCVVCPWHGSVFRLADGTVVHGPATGDQPAYDVRVEGGKVAVRRR